MIKSSSDSCAADNDINRLSSFSRLSAVVINNSFWHLLPQVALTAAARVKWFLGWVEIQHKIFGSDGKWRKNITLILTIFCSSNLPWASLSLEMPSSFSFNLWLEIGNGLSEDTSVIDLDFLLIYLSIFRTVIELRVRNSNSFSCLLISLFHFKPIDAVTKMISYPIARWCVTAVLLCVHIWVVFWISTFQQL